MNQHTTIESTDGYYHWVICFNWGRIVSKRVYKYKYDALFYRRAYLYELRGPSKRFSGGKGYVSQGKPVKTSHGLTEAFIQKLKELVELRRTNGRDTD